MNSLELLNREELSSELAQIPGVEALGRRIFKVLWNVEGTVEARSQVPKAKKWIPALVDGEVSWLLGVDQTESRYQQARTFLELGKLSNEVVTNRELLGVPREIGGLTLSSKIRFFGVGMCGVEKRLEIGVAQSRALDKQSWQQMREVQDLTLLIPLPVNGLPGKHSVIPLGETLLLRKGLLIQGCLKGFLIRSEEIMESEQVQLSFEIGTISLTHDQLLSLRSGMRLEVAAPKKVVGVLTYQNHPVATGELSKSAEGFSLRITERLGSSGKISV